MPNKQVLDFQYIISQLQLGKTTIEIAQQLNINVYFLRQKLKENKISPRLMHFNHYFFNKIDDEAKAYWLGFIYSDGNITYNDKAKQYRVRFGINKRDVGHLYKWHKAIDSNKVVAQYKTRPDLVYSEHNSKEMVTDLIKLGCVPNKSLIVTFPQNLPINLVKHFIRGYFDGDGGLSIDKSSSSLGQLTMSIVGTMEFLTKLQEYLNTDNKLQDTCGNGVTRQLNIKGNVKVITIIDFLYNNATIFLDRKKQLFDDFKKLYNQDSLRENFHKPSLGKKQTEETKKKRSSAMKKYWENKLKGKR